MYYTYTQISTGEEKSESMRGALQYTSANPTGGR